MLFLLYVVYLIKNYINKLPITEPKVHISLDQDFETVMEAAIVRASIQVFDARITSSKLNLKIRSDYNYIFALNKY